MANTVDIKLRVVTDGSDQKALKTSEGIANNYARANKEAVISKASKSAPTSATRAQGMITEQDYGKVRGGVGTGAAGRDFAKQAQGLGGLVGLYATFAANIFAVGAAYEALNKAAATERLAKATEMMSVQVGVNLKGVSKNLIEASGHALSFQDAMQFTNIGTSAGLAGKQIESLTKIARGAASALGRDVNDSVRRIIQGTAKQEQEILDELGIFVKSKQAFDKYAKEIGVKVEDLTGSQRTQAYANEVERLGKKWEAFAEIPDPFSKFSASGKNALNELLVSVNKFVSPVLSLLAESEAAIKSIIVLVSVSLARKALPEVGNVLTSLFAFDKTKINKDLDDLKAKLDQTYANIASSLKAKQLEMSKLVVPRVTSDAIQKATGDLGFTRGVSTQKGISNVKLTNTFTEKDLSIYKSYADVEKTVTSLVKEQVQDKKTQASTLKTLMDRGIVTKDSTYQKLVLDKEGQAVAANIYKLVEAENAGLAKQVVLQSEVLALTKETALARVASESINTDAPISKRKKSTKAASVALDTIDDAAIVTNTLATESNTAAKTLNTISNETNAASAKLVAEANTTTAAATATSTMASQTNTLTGKALQASLIATAIALKIKQQATLSATAAEQAMTAAMAKGLLATAGQTIVTLLNLGRTMIGVALGTETMATAANLAKTAFAGLFATINMGFMFVMIGITLWQAFGDSIKEFLGITNDATRVADAQKEALKTLGDSTILATATLEKYRLMSAGGNEEAKETIARYTAEGMAMKEHITQVEATIAAEEKAIAAAKAAKAAKEAAKKGEAYSIEASYYNELALNEKLSKAESDRFKTGAANFYANETQFKSKAITEEQYNTKRLLLLKEMTEIEKQVYNANQQSISAMAKLNEASTGVLEAIQEAGKEIDKEKIKKLGYNTDAAVKAYQNLTKTFDNNEDAGRKAYRVFEIINETVAVTGNTALFGAESVLQLGAALAKLKVLESLKGSGENVSAESLKQAQEAVDSALKALQAKGLLQDSIKTMFNKADTGKVKEYTNEAKAGFRDIERAIQATKLEQVLLDREFANTSSVLKRKDDLLGYMSEEAIALEKDNSLRKANTEQSQAQATAYLELRKTLDSKTRSKEEKATAAEAYANAVKMSDATRVAAEQAVKLAEETNRINSALKQIDNTYKDINAKLEFEKQLKANEASIDETRLNIAKETLSLSEAYVISLEAAVAQKAILSTLSSGAESNINTYNKGMEEIATKTDMPSDQRTKAEALITAEYVRQQLLLGSNAATQLTILDLTTQHRLAVAGVNEELAAMDNLASSLESVFGDVGKAIGDMGKAVLKMAKDDETYLKKKTKLEDDLFDTIEKGQKDGKVYSKEETKITKELSKLESKRAIDELGNISDIAGSTKKAFKEKTAAYKVLDTIEKASSAVRLALQVKEMAVKTADFLKGLFFVQADTAAQVAAAPVKAAAKTPSVIMSFMEWLGPWGAAAAAVAIAAALGGGGGGSSVSTVGLTSADRQSVQGTGQSYVDGQLVENGGGVFGDVTAKSNSISNSLDLILATEVEGLSYNNKMVDLLEKINIGIKGVAEAAYSVQGIRTGSAFGTVESSSSSPGILGLFAKSSSTSIVDSGIKLHGTFMDLTTAGDKLNKGLIQQYEISQTTSTKSGFLGIGASSSTSINTGIKDLDPKVQLQIRETFDYMYGVFAEEASAFGMDMETVDAILSGVDVDVFASLRGLAGEDLQAALSSIFSGIMDDAAADLFPKLKEFRKFGEGFQETVARVIDGNNKFGLALESLGLSFEGLPEVESTATAAMINAENAAFDRVTLLKQQVADFDRTYEDYEIGGSSTHGGIGATRQTNKSEETELLTQLAEAEEDYAEALAIRVEADAGMTVNTYRLTEGFIEASGGLEQFLENIKTFGDGFLSEAERIAPKANKLNTTFADLLTPVTSTDNKVTNQYTIDLLRTISDGGDGIIDTRDEFKRLYLANIDVATSTSENAEEAQGLWHTLDGLAPTFLEVAEAADVLKDSELDMLSRIYELTDDTAGGKNILNQQRAIELSKLDPTLIPLQKRIWALEDEADALDTLTESANTAISNLESAIDAQKEIYQKQADEASKLVSTITSIFNLLKTQVAELYNEVESTATMGVSAAKLFIDNALAQALATGTMPELGELTSSIQAIRNAANPANFATSVEADQERLSLAAKLSQLKDVSGVQLTAAEEQLKVAEDQLLVLDTILTNAKKQLNAALGIDTSVLGVTDAVNALDATLQAIKDNTKSLTAISDINKFINSHDWTTGEPQMASTRALAELAKQEGWSYEQIAEASGYSLEDIAALFKLAGAEFQSPSSIKAPTPAGPTPGGTTFGPSGGSSIAGPYNPGGSTPSLLTTGYSQKTLLPTGTYHEISITDPAEIAGLKFYSQALTTIGNLKGQSPERLDALAEWSKENGFGMQELANASGYSLAEVNFMYSKAGVPMFASGGDFEGGLRLVGEEGPELESTGPSRIYNAKQTQGILQSLNNTELLEEIRMLRNEVANLRAATEASADNTKITAKQLVRWDTEGVPVTSTTTDGIISVKTV